MHDTLSLHFLGTGNAGAVSLGCSSAVLERPGRPLLMIDCGHDSLHRFRHRHAGTLPPALFVTHPHLDHIGGLEGLFYAARFDSNGHEPVRLFVPVPLIEWLHKRIADYPNILAEGDANFWDAFQLIPVSDSFWHAGLRFSVFPARHHRHLSAFGLALEGRFVYTGDTRPIPEILNRYATGGETVFHDCALQGNPSHTGLTDLVEAYDDEQRKRLVLYHFESAEAGQALAHSGYRVAWPGDSFTFAVQDSTSADTPQGLAGESTNADLSVLATLTGDGPLVPENA